MFGGEAICWNRFRDSCRTSSECYRKPSSSLLPLRPSEIPTNIAFSPRPLPRPSSLLQDLTWGAPAALQAEDADIHFDSWMVNHGHQRRARRLSDGGAATATATATASAMASSSAAGETAAAMAVPLASDQPILAAPDVLALQLANFFAQANAEISRAFAAAEADPEVQRLAQSQAEKHAGRATSQPHVTSEVVVVPSSEVEVSTDGAFAG